MTSKIDERILQHYRPLKKLGKGAYGIVFQALDRKTNKKVALKKIFDAFQNQTDAQRTYREIIYLFYLNQHENIIKLHKVFKAHNDMDIYLVFELMQTDLHNVVYEIPLTRIQQQYIVYQILKAVKYIHSAGLVHRDLKPGNILINESCQIKIADFGMARNVDRVNYQLPIVTEYIATRWYRAPEILLNSNRYTQKVDIWSVGCIMAEILLRRVLFAGTSSANQLQLIFGVVGNPTRKDLSAMKVNYDGQLIKQVMGAPRGDRKLKKLIASLDGMERELVESMLQFNPKRRPSAEELLKHPYFAKFHDAKEEIVCDKLLEMELDDN